MKHLRALVLMATLTAPGCAAKVAFRADPAGAILVLPDGRSVVTPGVIQVKFPAFKRVMVSARAPNHEVLQVDLRKAGVRPSKYWFDFLFRPAIFYGKKPRAEVELILVPRHGPSGTWDPEDFGIDE